MVVMVMLKFDGCPIPTTVQTDVEHRSRLACLDNLKSLQLTIEMQHPGTAYTYIADEISCAFSIEAIVSAPILSHVVL